MRGLLRKGNKQSADTVSEQHISDRERILRKIKKYTPQTLNGHPLIVALDQLQAV